MQEGTKNSPLIILTGPTAVGKTNISIELAKKINAEIISADSMQVYRHMDIGTAKITAEEMQGIKHHLIDILDPDEEFNVIMFKELAERAVQDIYSRGRIPLVVGGTGFYIQALLYNVEFGEYDDDKRERVRNQLEEEFHKNGALFMHEYLRSIDPESASIIHMNNTKRMLNAIEFYKMTGQKMSEHNRLQHEKVSPYNFKYFVLNNTREKLYENIDRRVDIMLENGLVDEVRSLKNNGYSTLNPSMLGLGYKEISDYLDGITDFEEAVRLIKRDTRHFAKKQLTWFNREKTVEFINKYEYKDEDEILEELINKINVCLR